MNNRDKKKCVKKKILEKKQTARQAGKDLNYRITFTISIDEYQMRTGFES